MFSEPIEKLSQFTEYVEALPKEFILSRGQEREYELLPGALRFDDTKQRKYSRGAVQYFLNEFKVNCHNYVKQPINIRDDYEWMVYAQHYGIPTRLLDFTYSHVVSLMFAVENSFQDNEDLDAEVWFLNPLELNYKFASRSDILNISNGEKINLDNYDGPVAFKARKLNERINAQDGLFVYFQDNSFPLSDLKEDNIIRRLVIKGEYKKDILSSLYSMGIGFTTLYPELQSVTKDIIMKKNILEYVRDGE
ncbi:FRG domain-containing protein [Bacillus atrophaeus]|uniref:FRG domain-containing protein n=1 Tax=Bacillus atrophaeus TaxID=1452 RepID=UPI002281B040|nr:FRG domain-containing protein [Bacillus atrophaeus]MCY7945022.1 FRG domain-containing protein [Bacillus atrophaeus]MCY8097248.1 FRG domain-containing protein [Bacillus atrophaeus]MCY9168900.1 FRG domain-containing protein [Bacillus atrophaeus]MEC0739749.1 FRG domain-containing protein [Bacillus atrophaeus]MEC0746585.1 FRG domain-containing protein [Bacillus atrophaeus]